MPASAEAPPASTLEEPRQIVSNEVVSQPEMQPVSQEQVMSLQDAINLTNVTDEYGEESEIPVPRPKKAKKKPRYVDSDSEESDIASLDSAAFGKLTNEIQKIKD